MSIPRLIPLRLLAIVALTGLLLCPAPAHTASSSSAGRRTPSANPAPMMWRTQCADCPQLNFALGDQSIKVDTLGNVHVAYLGDNVYYAKFDGNTWKSEIIDRGPGLIYGTLHPPVALVLDKTNVPHIVYIGQAHVLTYAWRTPTGWITRTIASPSQVTDTSLALDSLGNPHIAYNSYYLMYASWTGSGWHFQQIDGSGYTEFHIGLVIDSTDKPHISYFYDRSDRRELRYITKIKVNNIWKWATPQIIDTTDWLGECNSIAVDQSGYPHITYRDATHSLVKHAHKTSSGWQIEVVDSAPWWKGSTSTVIDSAGKPRISYATNSGVTYAYWSGSVWITQTIPGWITDSSLALDSQGAPQLVYYSWDTRALIHAHLNGSQWVTEAVDHVSQVGRYTALALDSNGNPRISYTDYALRSLKYAQMTNGLWSTVTVDQIGNAGGYTHLALDHAGLPHISYYDSVSGTLRYAHQNGAAWITQTVDSIGSFGSTTGLALDVSDRPHISYYDSTRGNLRYAHWTGSVWVTQTVDSGTNAGTTTSLALDSADQPRIAYYDSAQSSLKYAAWNGGAWLTETVDNSANVGAYTALALDSNDIPHISYYDATHGALMYAIKVGAAWITQTVDSSGNVGTYTSIVIDSLGNPHISYYRNPGGLKYARWTGSQWVMQDVILFSVAASSAALALDAKDMPYLSYGDADYRYLRLVSGMPIRAYLPSVSR